MDKLKIKKALELEETFYLVAFVLSVLLTISVLSWAYIDNNFRSLLFGLFTLFLAYVELKRATHLRKLEEGISFSRKTMIRRKMICDE